jgi:hypothetical protein
MRNKPWQIIILSILILTILIGSSGCTSNVVKSLENGFDTLAHVPDHIGNIISGILGGLGDIGGALADQISNIVGGMTGR